MDSPPVNNIKTNIHYLSKKGKREKNKMIWVSKAPKNKAICSLKTSYKSANGSFSGLSIVY